MAGFEEVNKEFHPHCPHCNRKLDLRDYWHNVFARILKLASEGKEIRISDFGTFKMANFGGWSIKAIHGPNVEVKPRKILRFYMHDTAKKILNALST